MMKRRPRPSHQLFRYLVWASQQDDVRMRPFALSFIGEDAEQIARFVSLNLYISYIYICLLLFSMKAQIYICMRVSRVGGKMKSSLIASSLSSFCHPSGAPILSWTSMWTIWAMSNEHNPLISFLLRHHAFVCIASFPFPVYVCLCPTYTHANGREMWISHHYHTSLTPTHEW